MARLSTGKYQILRSGSGACAGLTDTHTDTAINNIQKLVANP